MRRLRHHGLSVVISVAFLIFMAAQIWTGRLHHNEELRDHGTDGSKIVLQPVVGIGEHPFEE